MTKQEFKKILDEAPVYKLKKMKFARWDDKKVDNQYLFLIPLEYYDLIPNRYHLRTIDGGLEVFNNGGTSKDTRFGVLPFGILRKNK
jgi:hypothetical protein